MNPREALERIKKLAPETFSQSALYHEAFATLTALVERDEAKKVELDDYWKTVCCPSCHDMVQSPFASNPPNYLHCPHCGQRLDWSGNNEKSTRST